MTALATDDFNRADGGLGANWTTATATGAPTIAGNACICAGDPMAAFYNGVTWPDDQYAQVKLKTMVSQTDNGIGPQIRQAAAADTKYFVIANLGDSRMYKVVAGSYTQIGSTGDDCATNDIIYLEAQGSSLIAKKNGSDLITATDSAIASGNAGIFGANEAEDPTCDDWEGGDFGAGGGAFTLDAAPGSFALSGQTAGLRIARALAAGHGAYALTGQAVDLKLSAGLVLSSQTGLFALAGQAADLKITRIIEAGAGTYSLIGQAAALRQTFDLIAAGGTFALTGQAADLKIARIIEAGAGEYILAGRAVTLTFSAAPALQFVISLTGELVRVLDLSGALVRSVGVSGAIVRDVSEQGLI